MNNCEYHELIIIGCGASGMTAAISASVYTDNILILERNDVPGKKITATGNGKCNFTNLEFNEDDLRGRDSAAAFSICKMFTNKDAIDYFRHLGIPAYIRNGYCYPYSNQAASVRDALVNKLEDLKIDVKYNTRVTAITFENNIYTLKTKDINYCCNKLIMATGGQAQHCFGTDGSMYYICGKLGHSVVAPLPALVGLTTSYAYINMLQGVRHEAEISLIINGRTKYTEYGEIVFSKNGISGIPVMNASRYAAEAFECGCECELSFDFFKDCSLTELEALIKDHYIDSSLTVEKSLTGVLNNKLISLILVLAKISPDYTGRDEFSNKAFHRIAALMKDLTIPVNATTGFDNAQCTAGGIPLNEIDNKTMESLISPGLYITGELLDVDGKCGGYNLQWAWTTGAVAGAYAGGGCFDKNKFLKA